MREAGKLVAAALQICKNMACVGIKTIEIDNAVELFYSQHGAIPLFKGYQGKVPFPAVTCISLNEQVIHGIPGQRILREGDLLKVDTACKLNGWCADAAITIPIGKVSEEKYRLIEVTQKALQTAIIEMSRQCWWSEVAIIVQEKIESAGYSVVTQYVGHGIGKKLHENPQVPNFFNSCLNNFDFKIENGLVLAVEPMVNVGKPTTMVLPDHWTVVTKDGLLSAHFEHTLAVVKDGIYVLTADDELIVN